MPQIAIPNLPQFSDSDLFSNAIAKLFGENWWDLLSGTSQLTGPIVPMLGALNTIVMCGITTMSLCVVVFGSLNTAQEGEIGGKKLHNFWWPLRTACAISMTAPIAKGGLSIFQAALLMCVGWGGTLANNFWEFGVNELAKSNMTISTAELPPHVQEEARMAAQIVYDAAVAQNYYFKREFEAQKSFDEKATNTSNPETLRYINNRPDLWLGPAFVVDSHTTQMAFAGGHHNYEHHWRLRFGGPFQQGYGLQQGDLGGFDIPGKLDDPMMLAKRNGIIEMYNLLEPVAAEVANGRPVGKGWLKEAMSAYLEKITPVYQNFAAYYPDHSLTQQVEKFRQNSIQKGWASAGAYPLHMSNLGEEARERQFMAIRMTPVSDRKTLKAFDDQAYSQFSKTIVSADSIFKSEPSLEPGMTIQEASLGGNPANFFSKWLKYILGGKFALQIWLTNLEQSDPITFFARWGHRLIDAGIAMWVAGGALAAFEGGIEAANDSVVGQAAGLLTGSAVNAGAGALLGGLKYLQTWLIVAVSGLLLTGCFFAYVFPVLPLLYWVFAVVTYGFLILEAIVAAPLWAASHAWSTQDEGFAGEMGKKGYLLFLELLIRPLLYVVGFFAVFIFMRVAGWFVARLFELYYYSYSAASESSVFWTNGPITTLAMMFVLGGMYVYLFRWLYTEGISNLPRKVINWIGGHGQSLGVAQGAEQMRAAIVGGFASVGSESRSGHGGRGSPGSPKKPEGKSGEGSGDMNDSGERTMPEFDTYNQFKSAIKKSS